MKVDFTIPSEASRIINKYIKSDSLLYPIYYQHCFKVTELALLIADKCNIDFNRDFLIMGAMLHDIGIIKTHAPEIGCFGDKPYIAHTYLGREMLELEGLFDLAVVCETHIGVGVTRKEIIENKLPLPPKDMLPHSIEEKLICYADKFYSKSGKYLLNPKPVSKIRKKVSAYGSNNLKRLDHMIDLFGYEYIYTK